MKLTRVIAVAAVAALFGCDDDSGTEPTAVSIAAKITSVQTSTGVEGTVKAGSIPEGNGPALTVASVLSVINGGTAAVPVTAAASFQRLAVAIQGVDDFYELFLPAGTTSAQLFITFAQSLPEISHDAGRAGDTGATSACLTQIPRRSSMPMIATLAAGSIVRTSIAPVHDLTAFDPMYSDASVLTISASMRGNSVEASDTTLVPRRMPARAVLNGTTSSSNFRAARARTASSIRIPARFLSSIAQ